MGNHHHNICEGPLVLPLWPLGIRIDWSHWRYPVLVLWNNDMCIVTRSTMTRSTPTSVQCNWCVMWFILVWRSDVDVDVMRPFCWIDNVCSDNRQLNVVLDALVVPRCVYLCLTCGLVICGHVCVYIFGYWCICVSSFTSVVCVYLSGLHAR